MKQIFTITGLVILLAAQSDLCRAQWVQANKFYGGPASCFTTSGSNIFAGTRNGVYRSSNNGVSWVESDNGLTDRNVYSITANGSEVFVGTVSGVSRSTNNGDIWMTDTVGLAPYNAIYGGLNAYSAVAVIGTNVIAVSFENGIFNSTNNGSNWTYSGYQGGGYTSCAVAGTDIFVAGAGVLRSSDYGKTWTTQNNGLPRNAEVTITGNGTNLYAVCDFDTIYLSTDYGTNWVSEGAPLSPILQQINPIMAIVSSGNDLFVSTQDPGLNRSTDNGVTWSVCLHDPNILVESLAFTGSTLIAGTAAGIFLSSDMGTNWRRSDSGFSHTGISAIVFNGTSLFAATQNDGVFRSFDDGNSWDKPDTGIKGLSITALSVLGTTLYAGADPLGTGDSNSGRVLHSTDNGASWIGPDSDVIRPWLTANAFAGSDTNVLAGAGDVSFMGGVFRSTDSGSSWTALSIPDNLEITSLLLVGHNIIVGTQPATQLEASIYLSTDDGITWASVYSIPLPPSSYISYNVFALGISGTTLFAGTYPGVFISTDSGKDWAPSGLSSRVVRCLLSTGNGIFAGTDSGIFLSTDNGSNWNPVFDGLTDLNVVALAVNDQKLYAATTDLVWSRPLSQMLARNAVSQTLISAPKIQSYPNPFSSKATITFTSPNEGYAEVTIVNLLGSQVARLFAGELAVGEHSFVWNMPAGHTNGMYECIVNMGGHMQGIQLVHVQ